MGNNQEKTALTEPVFYILLSLHSPMHGYGIMQFTKEISNGRVNIGPGTLYGAITTLLEKNWIKALNNDADSRKKEYEITEEGRHIVLVELDRLKELLEHGHKIVGRDVK